MNCAPPTPNHCKLFMPLTQQEKKVVTVLAGVIEPR